MGSPSTVRTALDRLHQLEALLVDEAQALATLDVAKIDATASAKDALHPQLAKALDALRTTPPSEDDRQALRDLRDRVATLAEANQVRLTATHGAIRDLITNLTQPTAVQTYGRRRSAYAPTQAILTAEVG